MGFKTVTRNLSLQRGSKQTDLGTIALKEDAKLMKEANVVARLAQVEMKAVSPVLLLCPRDCPPAMSAVRCGDRPRSERQS